MAIPKTALIESSQPLGPEARLLTLAMPEGGPLNFTGGQYVIVNTNIPLPGGKIAKRAYSILSGDREQGRFKIAVKKVGQGPGSNYMHETGAGASLPFSGPWGQFFPDEDLSGQKVLVLATDTGITAALGLIQGEKFKSAGTARALWLVESKDYFIPESFVRELAGRDVEIGIVPSVNHPDRPAQSLKLFKDVLGGGIPASVFLSGDGALLYPFKDELVSRGLEESRIKIECFFNNPFKKVGAS